MTKISPERCERCGSDVLSIEHGRLFCLDCANYPRRWDTDWPTEPGWYWFYGITSSQANKARLEPVYIVKTSDALAAIACAQFIYRGEAKGIWMPMIVPTLPKEYDRG